MPMKGPRGLEKKIAMIAFVGSSSFLCRGENELDYRTCADGNDFCLSLSNINEEKIYVFGVFEREWKWKCYFTQILSD